MARRRGVDGFGRKVSREVVSDVGRASAVEAASRVGQVASVPVKAARRATAQDTLVSLGGDASGKMCNLSVKGARIARPEAFGAVDFSLGPADLDYGVSGALVSAEGSLVMDDSVGSAGRHPIRAARSAASLGWAADFAPDGRPRVVVPAGDAHPRSAIRRALAARYAENRGFGMPSDLTGWLLSLYEGGELVPNIWDARGKDAAGEHRIQVPACAVERMAAGEVVRLSRVDRIPAAELSEHRGALSQVDVTISFRKSDLSPVFSTVAFYEDDGARAAEAMPVGNVRSAGRLAELWAEAGFRPADDSWDRAREALALIGEDVPSAPFERGFGL